MFKKTCLTFLFFFIILNLNAAPQLVKPDSLLNIFKLNNQDLRERKLIKYILLVFQADPINSLNADKIEVDELILKYKVENSTAFEYFIEGICATRKSNLNAAENTLLRAIELAGKSSDHYLLYVFFSHLGFLQTYKGNTIDAVSSFRMADKEAIILHDPYLRVIIDINISDIYYRNNFYKQSLFYLNQAQTIVAAHYLNEKRLKNIIYYNKCENYFRTGNVDSLKKYNGILQDVKGGTNNLYSYINRTNYYLYLLHHNYKNAIKLITALQKDNLYHFDNFDKQNLADAYYNTGQNDLAKDIITQLLAGQAQNNHPEIQLHLYQVLGEIAERKNDHKLAAHNFKMALQQSEDYINRLTQVGNISSEMKIDELEGSYLQKDEIYQRERLWLIFIVIVALLAIAIVAMFYRNIKQKRHYEQLLFAAKKEELAFINSHDVRKHLTNILGIIDVIKHSENKGEEYLQIEDRLFYSAQRLDEAIKNISEKLND